jgi:hypothetical protein
VRFARFGIDTTVTATRTALAGDTGVGTARP